MAKDNGRMNENKRRKRRGVPKTLVVFLLILVLAVGAVGGFAVGKFFGKKSVDTSALQEELARANERITQLETVLELAEIDPHADFMDDILPLTETHPDDPITNALTGNIVGTGDNNVLLVEGDQAALSGAVIETETEGGVVAEFEGGTVLTSAVLDRYNSRANEYMLMGMNVNEYAPTLLEDVLEEVVREAVLFAKAAELGFTDLTEEDRAQIEQEAQIQLDAQVDFFSELVAQEGMSPEDVRAATLDYLAEQGVTLESFLTQLTNDWWQTKLEKSVISTMVLTQDDLQNFYNELVDQQKENFTANPGDYELTCRYGDETIVYNPAGYRAFRHVLIALPEEDMEAAVMLTGEIEALDPETDATRIAELQRQLDALYTQLDGTVEEVADRISDGVGFEQLIHQYGEDPEMLMEPVDSIGYYVSANSTSYSDEIVAAAMALENVGDISEPVRSVSGVHFIQYINDVYEGTVPLSQVQTALTIELTENRGAEIFEEQVLAWIEEANVVYHMEELQ